MPAYYQNVWSHDDYIYHTTNSGIDVYSSDTSSLLYIVSIAQPAAVWVNDNYIYIGTVSSGVYRAAISGTASPYKQEPYLTSNETIYLHGNGNYLCVSTVSGVDRINTQTDNRVYTEDDYIHKCFQTVSGTLYYIENTRFYGVDTVDLGGNIRDWEYYQMITCSATPIDDAQAYLSIPDSFPFQHCNPYGSDIRFISNTNDVLDYSIVSWYPSAAIAVEIPGSGTTDFYMLYGNRSASAQGGSYTPGVQTIASTAIEQDLWGIIKPKLHVVYNPVTSWSGADYTYDEFYAEPGLINDIHVTSGTVFLGTDRGAHVIEELQGNEDNARKKYFFIQ